MTDGNCKIKYDMLRGAQSKEGLRGATVITTISGDELDLAWSLGADQGIHSPEQDFTAILGGSIEVVIDTSGGPGLDKSLSVLAPGGRLVSTADTPDLHQAAQQGITTAFISPAADYYQLSELARLTAAHRLKPLTGGTFPFSAEGLRSAHKLSEVGQIPGTIAIQIK